jgi:hypothetical protein
LMAGTVADLTLTAGRTGQTEVGKSANPEAAFLSSHRRTVKNSLSQQ